jgi:hypothetical protein
MRAVVGTVVGIAWGSLLLVYAAITSTALFAELSPRLLVFFVLTSGLAGLLTSKTSSMLYDWSTTKINGEPTRNS